MIIPLGQSKEILQFLLTEFLLLKVLMSLVSLVLHQSSYEPQKELHDHKSYGIHWLNLGPALRVKNENKCQNEKVMITFDRRKVESRSIISHINMSTHRNYYKKITSIGTFQFSITSQVKDSKQNFLQNNNKF